MQSADRSQVDDWPHHSTPVASIEQVDYDSPSVTILDRISGVAVDHFAMVRGEDGGVDPSVALVKFWQRAKLCEW